MPARWSPSHEGASIDEGFKLVHPEAQHPERPILVPLFPGMARDLTAMQKKKRGAYADARSTHTPYRDSLSASLEAVSPPHTDQA